MSSSRPTCSRNTSRRPIRAVTTYRTWCVLDAGDDVWVYDGRQFPNIGLNAVAGRPRDEYGMDPTSYDEMRPGCWDVDARIGDMNANGVLASLCFPSFPRLCGQVFAEAEDKDLAHVLVRAYNDWHVHSWCGKHPGRFIPLGLLAVLGRRLDRRGDSSDSRTWACTQSRSRRTRRNSVCRACMLSTGIRSGRRVRISGS